MTIVFIAGSIKISNLDNQVKREIDEMLKAQYRFAVGDARGVDTAVQRQLFNGHAKGVKIYCSGGSPRNNVGNWSVQKVRSSHPRGTREFFTAKDVQMAKDADQGLMVWDSRSTGTLSNVVELLKRGKTSTVFVQSSRDFHEVEDVDGLESLVTKMPCDAFKTADYKIGLSDSIAHLRNG